ncbi:unnamed protein product [Adineta steineri]|uniref:Uncharacterized protein n=1 Tax=Adineta steineri TaxID=433720 RepID=A0A814WGS1_9BILA|nr:unnamed protein product [Adineta steineri]CAF1583734.1 unnamed protein product [Adineta steineri]
MTAVSVFLNSIFIPIVQIGFMKFKFNSTYRSQLSGILSPDEFQESMKNINQTLISMNNFRMISLLTFFLGLKAAFICISMSINGPFKIDVLFGFSIALFILSLISLIILIFIVPISLKRIREVIAKESLKYCSRLPAPCDWRLENWNQGNLLCPSYKITCYRLVIVTDRFMIEEDAMHHSEQVVPVSITLFQHQDNSSPPPYSHEDIPISESLFQQHDDSSPPPYSDQLSRFCSQCNVTRSDLTIKFCSLCGHSFDKY